ncbi:MAG: SpoIID/LytB domain-containing protein [Clostridia bacterium]|nr:SpoIID/LytB domain-containing protein [Clostridia bacterium]
MNGRDRMGVKLMSLGLETTSQIIEAQEMIEAAFKKILECSEKFTQYNSEKLFLTELSKAVTQDDVIVLSAEAELFVPFKSFVAKAFQLKKRQNRQISKLIKSSCPEIKTDTETFESQSTIPVGAVPLLSHDGLYSGFAIKSNNQIVIVLPLDTERLGTIINIDLEQYLLQILSNVAEIPQQEEEKQEQKQEEKKQLYDEELIKNTVQKLAQKQLSFSVAETKTLDFLAGISNSISGFSQVVLLSDYSAEKGQMPPREYAINLARGAKERLGTPLGASLTKVFITDKEDGTKEMFLYVCIADDQCANAIKMFAKQGETPPQLIFSAIDELFKMVASWIDTENVLPSLLAPKEEEIQKEEKKVEEKNRNKLKLMVAIMLVLSIVASVVVVSMFDDIYNIRGTLAQKAQSQLGIESEKSPLAENVDIESKAVINNDELDNERGGLELDSAFIDAINKQSTETTTTTTTTTNITKAKTTTTKVESSIPASSPSSSSAGVYPEKLVLDGVLVDTAVAVARIVEAEMGKSFATEALKAQTVAVFSYIKCNNWRTDGLSKGSTYSDKVMQAVQSVLGQTVTYNGQTALTPFFAMSAGKTVASNAVWDTEKQVAYLVGGVSSGEKDSGLSGYKTTKTYSSSELKSMIESKLKITLGADPSQWIKINAHDSSVSADVGYVSFMNVGEKTISGHIFRTSVMGYGIRSHCFSFAYDAGNDLFTFTVYGYGHGVGMSQQGANYYANQGWDYKAILKYYFPGTQVE